MSGFSAGPLSESLAQRTYHDAEKNKHLKVWKSDGDPKVGVREGSIDNDTCYISSWGETTYIKQQREFPWLVSHSVPPRDQGSCRPIEYAIKNLTIVTVPSDLHILPRFGIDGKRFRGCIFLAPFPVGESPRHLYALYAQAQHCFLFYHLPEPKCRPLISSNVASFLDERSVSFKPIKWRIPRVST